MEIRCWPCRTANKAHDSVHIERIRDGVGWVFKAERNGSTAIDYERHFVVQSLVQRYQHHFSYSFSIRLSASSL